MNKNNYEKGQLMSQITTLAKEYELTFDKDNLATVSMILWYYSGVTMICN